MYGEWTSETDAQFVAGASNIAAGGLSIALAFAVGTPIAPFLIAGILVFNGIGFVANYEQDHSTPPLADDNWDKQQA